LIVLAFQLALETHPFLTSEPCAALKPPNSDMDPSIQKALTDKLYDKRKSGALDLENLIRESLAANDHDRIQRIVSQLCHDYAYQVHQPHARNGGLIGLAAASIALGPVRVAHHPLDTLRLTTIPGSGSLSRRNRPSCPRLFYRSRCPSSILRMREHVQHCKSRKGRDTAIFQPSLRCLVQGRRKGISTHKAEI
jgi:hypothetical protein